MKKHLPQSRAAIIGAGPVGLWTGFQLKLLNPDLEIIVYEKRGEHQAYARSYVLLLDYSCLNKAAYQKKDPVQVELVQRLQEALEKKARIKTSFFGKKEKLCIRVNDLQETLLQAAEALNQYYKKQNLPGITVVHNKEITDLKTLDADIIIGAEGTNSPTRKVVTEGLPRTVDARSVNKAHVKIASLLPASSKDPHTITVDEQGMSERRNLQFIVQLKYEANILNYETEELEGRKLLSLSYMLSTYARGKFFFSETVSKPNDQGRIAVTAQFFVSPRMYDSLRDISLSHTKPLGEIPLPYKLENAILDYLATRKYKIREEFTEGRIGKLPLPIYRSGLFAKTLNTKGHKQVVAITGDASMAVPYFRALNAGFLSASELCKLLTSYRSGKLTGEEFCGQYNRFMEKLYVKEAAAALTKDTGLTLLTSLLSAGRSVFSSSSSYKLDEDLIDNYKTHLWQRLQEQATARKAQSTVPALPPVTAQELAPQRSAPLVTFRAPQNVNTDPSFTDNLSLLKQAVSAREPVNTVIPIGKREESASPSSSFVEAEIPPVIKQIRLCIPSSPLANPPELLEEAILDAALYSRAYPENSPNNPFSWWKRHDESLVPYLKNIERALQKNLTRRQDEKLAKYLAKVDYSSDDERSETSEESVERETIPPEVKEEVTRLAKLLCSNKQHRAQPEVMHSSPA